MNPKKFISIVLIIIYCNSGIGQSTNVVYRQINENGLIGYLAIPDTLQKFPAILTLKGSGGGLSTFYPEFLGKHGYVVLSLAYSGIGHLPKSEKELPLEYFEKGVQWLKQHPNVDSTRLGIIGNSLGAESALLFASKFPVFRALVGVVPTHVVWQYGELEMKDTIPTSAFSYRGKPITYVPFKFTREMYQKGLRSGPWGEMFENSLKDSLAVAKAAIPVEKINAPILLFSGKDDSYWPSTFMSDEIIKRLKKNNYPFEYKHISYPETGHFLFVKKDGNPGGGSGKGAQFADEDSQKQILSFFNKYLKK